MAADLYRRAFARAAKILGGKKQLADHLQIDRECLDKWSSADGRPPMHALQSLAVLLKREMLANHKPPSSTAKKPARRNSRKR